MHNQVLSSHYKESTFAKYDKATCYLHPTSISISLKRHLFFYIGPKVKHITNGEKKTTFTEPNPQLK